MSRTLQLFRPRRFSAPASSDIRKCWTLSRTAPSRQLAGCTLTTDACQRVLCPARPPVRRSEIQSFPGRVPRASGFLQQQAGRSHGDKILSKFMLSQRDSGDPARRVDQSLRGLAATRSNASSSQRTIPIQQRGQPSVVPVLCLLIISLCLPANPPPST